jgi:hypothetical protein
MWEKLWPGVQGCPDLPDLCDAKPFKSLNPVKISDYFFSQSIFSAIFGHMKRSALLFK